VIEVPEWMGSGLFLDPRRLPPVVVRLHTHLTLVRHLNDLPMNLDARLAAFLEARALRGAAMILANSRALADRLSADYEVPRDAIDVLPLGVDLARFEVASHGELKSQLGLPGGGPEAVITDLGVLRFDPQSNEMALTALHPGVTVERVRANTGWELRVASQLERTRPPSTEELRVLRDEFSASGPVVSAPR